MGTLPFCVVLGPGTGLGKENRFLLGMGLAGCGGKVGNPEEAATRLAFCSSPRCHKAIKQELFLFVCEF